MKITDLVWLAAVIDCEGSIVVDNIRGYLHPRIVVYNTCRELVVRTMKNAGIGSVRVKKLSPLSIKAAHGHPKKQWIWRVGGKKILPLLLQLIPHLIVKKKQARVAIRILRNQPKTRKWVWTTRPVDRLEKTTRVEQ